MNLPVPAGEDTTGYRLGPPQRGGELTLVPVLGPAYRGVAPPRSGLKLSRVVAYGSTGPGRIAKPRSSNAVAASVGS